jgi:N utilization substance protein B
VSQRGQARERALDLLYEAEAKDVAPSDVLAELVVAADPFTEDLVAGVDRHGQEIDGLIRRFARGWALERMPVVDRAVLRLGVYELCHHPDVPTGVVLSEAVDLASRFSTDESAPYVNGVLAAIAAEVRDEDRAPGTAAD